MAGMLATCQPGFEDCLTGELTAGGAPVIERGPGWVRCGDAALAPDDLAFAHWLMVDPQEVRAATVNALAQAAVDVFAAALGAERVETAWPCRWAGAGAGTGLDRRAAVAAREFQVRLRKRFARVARLAECRRAPGPGGTRGLFVWLAGFDRAFVARSAWLGGQRRMADDPAAPSRSYLKIEEAYGVLGAEPQAGDSVVDLGAAPGGWSYSAAKRGAHVIAVDHGPLKGGARNHPLITHRRVDAFGFHPEPGATPAWMLCDLVAEPHHVLRDLVAPWLAGRWCRRFVVNLKFGRVQPVALLGELRAPGSPLATWGGRVRIRHLYHDREELTIVGSA